MNADLLEMARVFLVTELRGKSNPVEAHHPWRRDGCFAVLHSLRVEQYVLKILARQPHTLDATDVRLLRLAAILHDIARLDDPPHHAALGAMIAKRWLMAQGSLTAPEIDRVTDLVATHSAKHSRDDDFGRGVLKDADTLDEIGLMSIFMAGNWIDQESVFFFHDLRDRLVEREIPFCDEKLAILNTQAAKEMLLEKRNFIMRAIAHLTEELPQADDIDLRALLSLARRDD